ncbi:MAG: alpha-ribazole phosphatase [Acetobacterium woodii]|nr:alpha-ribazole phosphatase [Acetobacterium woodii]
MNKTIYLVRHGEIEWNKEKAYIGQIDLPLSEQGKIQAAKRREFFAGINLDKAYTSPLKRCVATLNHVLENRAVPRETIADLQEISMGDWEGRSFAEIKSKFPVAYEKRGQEIASFAPPNGESFLDLQQRVMPAFKEIAEKEEEHQIIILAHAGVIRVILTSILGLTLNHIFNWPILYTGIYQLCFDQNQEKWMCKNR